MTGPCGIVVVGSLHYDIFVDAPHRPAAGETVTGFRWSPKFGGKGGNQAAAIVKADSRCLMVSAVGRDGFGQFLLDRLSAAGVETSYVACVDGVGSGMSVAISDAGGDYGAVIVSGSNLKIDPKVLDCDAVWDGAKHLVLQNEIPETTNIAAAYAARSRNIKVWLNAAPARPTSSALLDLVDVLVVNAGEAEALCGVTICDLTSAQTAAQTLASRFSTVLVTAGADGVAVAAKGESFSQPAHKVKLVSTHGAGDCFLGATVAACAQGANLREAIQKANLAAARHVSGNAEIADVHRS